MELHLFIDMPFCVLVPLCNLTYLKLVFHTARSTLLNVITASTMQRKRAQTTSNSTILGLSDISAGECVYVCVCVGVGGCGLFVDCLAVLG